MQKVDNCLPDPDEVLLVAHARCGLAVLRVGEDEVHVGRQVEFSPAQLAQPKHRETLNLPGSRARLSGTLGLAPFSRLERRRDEAVRHVGKRPCRLFQRGGPGKVAPDDPELAAVAQQAQLPLQVVGLRRTGNRRGQFVPEPGFVPRLIETARILGFEDPFALLRNHALGEVAQCHDAAKHRWELETLPLRKPARKVGENRRQFAGIHQLHPSMGERRSSTAQRGRF